MKTTITKLVLLVILAAAILVPGKYEPAFAPLWWGIMAFAFGYGHIMRVNNSTKIW